MTWLWHQSPWLVALAAIAAPALLLALLPRRWLGWAVLGWLSLPFSATAVATVVSEAMHPRAYPIGTLFYGLALVFPIVAVPWVICCCIGFAIGFRLNRLRRAKLAPGTPAPPPPVAAPPPPTGWAMPAFTTPPQAGATSAGWRNVHVGVSHDGFTIDGVDVWGEPWRAGGGATVVLPDPGHAVQSHRYDHYEIGPAATPVRFIATELSNGVWAFWLAKADPLESAHALAGTSADGALRFEYRSAPLVNGRYDPPDPWAVLIDAHSGEVLLDCADWAMSRISRREDGSLLVHVGQNLLESAFRIDSATRRFAPLGTLGEDRPLAELPAAVARARAAAAHRGNSPAYRRFSPDGSIRVDLESVEWSNSHWVNSPRVIDLPSGLVALDLWGSPWDANVSFPRSRCVRLGMRSYRLQGRGPAAELDLARGSYQIVDWPKPGDRLAAAPLAACAAGLESFALGLGGAPALPPPPPKIAWRAMLLILLGAMVAIGAATTMSIWRTPQGLRVTPMATIPRLVLPPPRRD